MGLDSSSTPRARPAGLAIPAVRPTSEESAALRSYLVQVQSAQLSQGLLREDGGGPDTPFTADMLARNFEEIVFFNEYASALRGRGGASPLRRWQVPVRISTVFGASVPKSQQAKDSSDVKNYVRRLARVTDHPITTFGMPNFIVVFASEDDRADALKEAARRLPGITEQSLAPLRTLDRGNYCVVAAYGSGSDPNTYTAAVAVVRAENPALLRLSCIHEELAQGLGLANDSRTARPSIFNDDDEFALLTDHDELLLRMLYDPRLKPGMSASDAAPLTRIIARELTSADPL
ncbi:MAG: DUF2927 domain-containing protein [Pseudomonadota bacterium]